MRLAISLLLSIILAAIVTYHFTKRPPTRGSLAASTATATSTVVEPASTSESLDLDSAKSALTSFITTSAVPAIRMALPSLASPTLHTNNDSGFKFSSEGIHISLTQKIWMIVTPSPTERDTYAIHEGVFQKPPNAPWTAYETSTSRFSRLP